MKQKIFAVYDAKAETFGQPIFAPTKGAAIRSFQEAVNTDGHELNKWSDDFTLFELGEYDQVAGVIEPLPAPVSVGNALMFKVAADVTPLKAAR